MFLIIIKNVGFLVVVVVVGTSVRVFKWLHNGVRALLCADVQLIKGHCRWKSLSYILKSVKLIFDPSHVR